MRRRLFNIIAMISALLFGLVVLFWVRSYLKQDNLFWPSERGTYKFYSTNGLLAFDVFESGMRRYESTYYDPVLPTSASEYYWRRSFFGFSFDRTRWSANGRQGGQIIISLPYWFLAGLSSILPLIALRRWIRSRRHRNPFACITCGYDLRATPDRCPECGTVVNR